MGCRAKAYKGEGNPRWLGAEAGDCTCEICGKEFRIKPSHKAGGDGRFCSFECKKQSYPEKPVYQCLNCGNSFEIHACHAERGEWTFCSIQCRMQYNAARVNCTCIVCGKEFYVKECDLVRSDKKGVGKFCSMECKARWMSNHAQTTGKARGKGGKRSDLNDLFVRSSWEANYARYLNWLISIGEIKKWEYEPDTFEFHKIKRGSKFYTPDFKITNNDNSIEYHEVKGWMNQESQTKLNRMQKYYPDIKVVLIDRDAYHGIAKDVKRFIPNWE